MLELIPAITYAIWLRERAFWAYVIAQTFVAEWGLDPLSVNKPWTVEVQGFEVLHEGNHAVTGLKPSKAEENLVLLVHEAVLGDNPDPTIKEFWDESLRVLNGLDRNLDLIKELVEFF
jgi:hypothetical protein